MNTDKRQTLKIIAKIAASLIATAAIPALIFVLFLTGAWLSLPPRFPTETLLQRVAVYAPLFPFAFGVAFIHTLLFGLPAFLLGLRFRAIYWWSCLIVAFVIGFTPLTVISLSSQNFTIAPFLAFGLLGAIGGLTFWLLWHFWVRYETNDLT